MRTENEKIGMIFVFPGLEKCKISLNLEVEKC
jgi:hypothetical protein